MVGMLKFTTYTDEKLNEMYPLPDDKFHWVGYISGANVIGIRIYERQMTRLDKSSWQIWTHRDTGMEGRFAVRSYSKERAWNYVWCVEEALTLVYARFLTGAY